MRLDNINLVYGRKCNKHDVKSNGAGIASIAHNLAVNPNFTTSYLHIITAMSAPCNTYMYIVSAHMSLSYHSVRSFFIVGSARTFILCPPGLYDQ